MIDGETAGTTNQFKRIEAIQIRIVPKYKKRYNGIDVSSYQKNINWTAVKNAGIDFAIIRAGFRGWGSAGTLVTDEYFARNVQEATRAGVDIGVYFYSQAINVAEAREEAYYVLNLISSQNVTLKYPVVIDTERTTYGTGRADSLPPDVRTEIVNAFCEVIEANGYISMVYANKNWLLDNLQIGNVKSDIWLAHYTSSTDYPYSYTIWQYTSSGRVNGIEGDVDMDIGYKRY